MIGMIHYIPTEGTNIDLSGITATASDVLSGKVIVDANGNSLTGTMANIDAVEQSLSINGTYNIPQGYHNGSGKVIQSISTMASQTLNPKTNSQTVLCSGKYMTGNVVLNAPSTMVGQTITPKSSSQTISCSDKYMTGNIVVNAASNIYKCVTGTVSSGTSQDVTYDGDSVQSWTVSLSGFKTVLYVVWYMKARLYGGLHVASSATACYYGSSSKALTGCTFSNTKIKLPAVRHYHSSYTAGSQSVYYRIYGYAS